MPEETLFEVERQMSRAEIADYLRTVAGKLEGSGSITLEAGDQRVEVSPPANPTFEVAVERETSSGGGGASELSVEFELEWDETEGRGDDGSLRIE